jgi:geranylgeranyl reductase family protein
MKRSGKRGRYDVIVVGGGPAGAVVGWRLASTGAKVLVLERTRYPREKVCGDYVEPRGLRVLEAMGCLTSLEADSPLPITHSSTYVEFRRVYSGPIPFYGRRVDLPAHGYIVPRERLDHEMIQAAEKAGVIVREQTLVNNVLATDTGVEVRAQHDGREIVERAHLVVGADGVNSVVAKSAGLLVTDPRHTAVSQRAYAAGIDGDVGEAAFFFEQRLFPGYGWMFPMRGQVVNIGVGILSETRNRRDVSVPHLFDAFFEDVKRRLPRCGDLRLDAAPIGGIVKTYGAAGCNHFDGGLLVGDAGSFVDPMTGEGITPAIESAFLAADVVTQALNAGRFDAAFLSRYERRFREYFDPSMIFVDLCAAYMRNKHLARPWLKLLARGCEVAQRDEAFGRVGGTYFGGLETNPYGILSTIWLKMARELMALAPRSLSAIVQGGKPPLPAAVLDMGEWQLSWWRSFLQEPAWSAAWLLDLQRKWLQTIEVLTAKASDPRSAGLL